MADHVSLVSHDPQALLNLSHTLTSVNVLVKIMLLLYHPNGDYSAKYWQDVKPIMMDVAPLPLSAQAEHVGVISSRGGGNLASITARMAGNTKSLYSVISCEMARSHSPATLPQVVWWPGLSPAVPIRHESAVCPEG